MDPAIPRRILVVDDEPNILSAVRRELNTPPLGRHRYEVEGFSDPMQALDRAREQAFDAVISDYRMPGMSGLDFLKAFAVFQPDCARLVLSGHTDMAALAKMVNETHIFRFIPKPWHDYYLKSSVAQAVEFRSVQADSRRLADLVRAHGIAVPPLLEDETENVLIVDDEPAILSSLSRALTVHAPTDDLFAAIRFELTEEQGGALQENRIRITKANSGHEALKLLGSTRFSCILADFRMPDMNGIELLAECADRQPDCERILISGQLAQEDLITAVDSAHIFGFIAKPWQDYELKACVAQALARRRMVMENRILADMVARAGVAPA